MDSVILLCPELTGALWGYGPAPLLVLCGFIGRGLGGCCVMKLQIII